MTTVTTATTNLTELEQVAIDSEVNLSDGHPRQSLTPAQRAIVDAMPDLFDEATRTPLRDLEPRAQRAFFGMLGQHRAPIAEGRVFSVYSSSVATTAVGYAMAESDERVALLHPTFDNIHDLLSRQLGIVPLPEPFDPATGVAAAFADGATAIFLTTPNNPTGQFLDEPTLRRLVEECVTYDLTVCLDTSFRGFEPQTQFDHYALLEDSGVRYVVIEDTGKLWPVSELKLGFVAVSHHWRRPVEHALSDILLSVSPFVLALVEQLALDGANGGLEQLHALVATNRGRVARLVADLPGVTLLDAPAAVSVARLELPSSSVADDMNGRLRERGVHVLPCGPFHWDAPSEGSAQLRIALARDPEVIDSACDVIADVWEDVRP
ncbi:aminotransferase class I/II-fold pyridoxal phosphate-dependent enzyme [Terrabacter sp. AAH1]